MTNQQQDYSSMLTAKELTYRYFLDNSSDFQPLSHIADIVSGIYTHSSQILVFEDFRQTADASVGYSRKLRDYVKVEADIAMPFLKSSDDIAFFDPESDRKNRGIVLFEVKDNIAEQNAIGRTFFTNHPALTTYIKSSAPEMLLSDNINSSSWFNVLNRKQSEILLKGKHVLAVKDGCCESFFDEMGKYAIPYDMYGIYVNTCSLPDKLMTAIFNSSLFSFLRQKEQLRNKNMRNSKYESVSKFPIPVYAINSGLLKVLTTIVEVLTDVKSSKGRASYPSSQIKHYLYQMLDMAVFELYFSDYVHTKGISVWGDFDSSIFYDSYLAPSEKVPAIYNWFMKPDNKVRQKIMLLDSRSHELLYNIYTYLKR